MALVYYSPIMHPSCYNLCIHQKRISEDELLLTEVWQDAEAIEFHKNSEHFAKLGELKAEYVENTEFMKFSAEQV
jgi:quinol monooxygenase YgiN